MKNLGRRVGRMGFKRIMDHAVHGPLGKLTKTQTQKDC